MKRTIFTILILLGFMLIKCGEPLPNDYGGEIISIKFGTDWDSVRDSLLNVGNSFDYGIDKVYYEIKFEGHSLKGGMVKKVWETRDVRLLESTSFMPKDSKRICGELHYYDLRDMDTGRYRISVFYFEEDVFKEYPYSIGVNRTFTIH